MTVKRAVRVGKACERFLAALAATANVQRAAAAAEIDRNTVYERRQRDPAFAHQWRMALLAGYDRIELALIRRALGLPAEPPVEGEEAGELDVELALKLLTRYKPLVERATAEGEAAAFRATPEAAARALLTKLRAHARRADVAEAAAEARAIALGGAPLLLADETSKT